MTKYQQLAFGLLACAVAVTGCENSATHSKPAASKSSTAKVAAKVDDEHDHEHGPGPHSGTVFDFGKYHAEFVVDHGKKEATLYILDGSAKKAVPIEVEKLVLNIKTPMFQVELKAVPQEGDPKGKSSRFVGTHDNLGKEQEFEGTVSGEIAGKPALGDFKEKAHEHEKK